MELSDQELEDIWNTINWKAVENFVKKLQRRIFLAAESRNYKKLRNLQKLARKSFYFHLYAIKQVTSVNKGKNTPGVDGFICITVRDRVKFLTLLKFFDIKKYKPHPIKRVYIPKPNGGTRPLGIPTIFDRIIQTVIKLVLEPEFEQIFHPNSFGFRPGRSCQDAIEIIREKLKGIGEVYILDADLKGFFDNIPHEAILKHFTPIYRSLIEKWLKSGIMERGYFKTPDKGTPQGGVIFPLLANIALNEFDHMFNSSKNLKPNDIRREITTLRFADDFVVISKSKTVLIKIYNYMKAYFQRLGLKFNESKTCIVNRSSGFDFLGFHFIQYPHSYLRVMPSRKSITRVCRNIKDIFMNNKQAKVDGIIYILNSIIRGWAIYFRFCSSWKTFKYLDKIIFRWVWNWCKRRHPRKSKEWIVKKYFTLQKGNKWRLTGKHWKKIYLCDIKRRQYKWRVGDMSPMNPRYQKLWISKPECNNSPQIKV